MRFDTHIRGVPASGTLYSPRLDIAVGPRPNGDFDALAQTHDGLLRRLYDYHRANVLGNPMPNDLVPSFEEVLGKNHYARCFLGIEIENSVSRKHLMGGAINAAALGRIGIAVGWTAEKVKALVKLRSYLLFLASVGKNTFDPANLLILSKDQLDGAVNSLLERA
ncbi:MAG: hypothetical protein ACLQOO_07770 [Terriglobia bacterium]